MDLTSSGAGDRRGAAGRGQLLLVALIPPSAWALHLLVSYFAVSFACERRAFGGEIAGLSGAELVLVALTLLAAVAIAVAGLRGRRIWRESRTGHKAKGGSPEDRSGFMGFVGMVLSALFLFGLVLGGLPPFILMLRECGA